MEICDFCQIISVRIVALCKRTPKELTNKAQGREPSERTLGGQHVFCANPNGVLQTTSMRSLGRLRRLVQNRNWSRQASCRLENPDGVRGLHCSPPRVRSRWSRPWAPFENFF